VSDHSFTTAEFIEQTLMGKVPGVAKMMFPMVDVRDAALAHVRAVEVEQAKNQRIIIVGANIWFKEFAQIMYDGFSKFGYKPKTGEIKFWMLKVASWIDDTAKTIIP
jgi:dihydroflavonol-4-reductase